ncbi:MAG: NAD(P)H-dependent oxidoreductase subunit E [bacterium]
MSMPSRLLRKETIFVSIKVQITKEKLTKLYAAMERNKLKPGPLMPTLHEAQQIFGCIPIEVQKLIGKELHESVAKINGVVTFYGQFSIDPKGENVINVCLGTACYVRGSQGVLDAFSDELKLKAGQTSEDGKFTLQATRCIGACGLAPIFTVNETVYGNATVQKAKEALAAIR